MLRIPPFSPRRHAYLSTNPPSRISLPPPIHAPRPTPPLLPLLPPLPRPSSAMPASAPSSASLVAAHTAPPNRKTPRVSQPAPSAPSPGLREASPRSPKALPLNRGSLPVHPCASLALSPTPTTTPTAAPPPPPPVPPRQCQAAPVAWVALGEVQAVSATGPPPDVV